MRTKQEIKEAFINLQTKPEKTGWGADGNDVSNYLEALRWVLNEKSTVLGQLIKEARKKSTLV